jgi:hypothetical protein
MIIVFVILIAALGAGLYLTIMYSSIPGAVDERLGKLDALPDNLGLWTPDTDSEAGKLALAKGKRREVRTLYEPGGLLRRHCLVIQGRLRDVQSGEIEDIEPEQRVTRRRHKV